jgi:hypothetical protein
MRKVTTTTVSGNGESTETIREYFEKGDLVWKINQGRVEVFETPIFGLSIDGYEYLGDIRKVTHQEEMDYCLEGCKGMYPKGTVVKGVFTKTESVVDTGIYCAEKAIYYRGGESQAVILYDSITKEYAQVVSYPEVEKELSKSELDVMVDYNNKIGSFLSSLSNNLKQ